MKKLISIVLFVVAVIMLGFGFYILNSNKYTFEIVLSKSLDYLVDNCYNNTLTLEQLGDVDKYRITTNTSLKSSNVEVLSLAGDTYIDKDEYFIDLDANVQGQKFMGVGAYMSDDKIYLKLKEVMDKFYYIQLDNILGDINSEDYTSISDITKDELKILTKHFEKSMLQELKDSDFEKNSVTLTFEGKTYKTSQISLNLSAKDIRQIIINLLNNIINDNRAVQVLQKFDNSITANDIKEGLLSFEKETINASDVDIFNISYYINGVSDVVRVEFLMLNNTVDNVVSDNLLLTIDMYKNISNNDVSKTVIKINNEEIFNIKMTKLNEVKTNLEIIVQNSGEVATIKGYYNKTSESIILNLDMLYNNEKVGTLIYKVNPVTKNKEYKYEIQFNASDDSFSIVSINNLYLNEEIPVIDINDSDSFENISESELDELTNYISEKLTELGLEEYLSDFETNDDYMEEV